MNIDYIQTKTIKEFVELGNKVLVQFKKFNTNEFKYKNELEHISTELSEKLSYVLESISMRLHDKDIVTCRIFIKELKETDKFNLDYYSDAEKFFEECLGLIKKYGKDEDLLILTTGRGA